MNAILSLLCGQFFWDGEIGIFFAHVLFLSLEPILPRSYFGIRDVAHHFR